MKSKRIVVTRAKQQSELLIESLRERGAVPVLAPMVAFQPPDDPAAVDKAIRGIGRYDWVFLTSQNALRALQDRCDALGISLAGAVAKSKLAAVGPATAEAIRKAGLTVDYIAERHQGAGLAEELKAEVREKRILLPRSDRANPDLVRTLENSGARVTEVLAYKTVRPDEGAMAEATVALGEGADAVLFFSPSAVHHLQQSLTDERFLELSKNALFVAIGPVTADALREAKVERVRTASDTTVDAVLEVLTDYFSATEGKLPAGAKAK